MGLIEQFQQLIKSLFQWWVIITPWQQGIRVRLGKNSQLLHPGVHLKIPFIDIVYMQPIRMRAQFVKDQTLTTKCGKIIAVSSVLQYQIIDLLMLYKSAHNIHDLIDQKIQDIICRYVFEVRLEELKLEEVKEHVMEELNLDEYGLEINGFSIVNFANIRAYRLMNSELGQYTSYDQRLETSSTMK